MIITDNIHSVYCLKLTGFFLPLAIVSFSSCRACEIISFLTARFFPYRRTKRIIKEHDFEKGSETRGEGEKSAQRKTSVLKRLQSDRIVLQRKNF